MKVFISWSGSVSKALAEAFREWLPNVIQAIDPWLSASDIEKGARWSSDIAAQLDEAKFGLICLTSENLEAPWILFEAGALSKTLGNTFVCPYLLHVEPADLKGPLVQFQSTKAEREDTRKLLHTINRASGDKALPDTGIDRAFDKWWPDLEQKLVTLQPGADPEPRRDQREMIEEILELVRNQSRNPLLGIVNNPAKAPGGFSVQPPGVAQGTFNRAGQPLDLLARMVLPVVEQHLEQQSRADFDKALSRVAHDRMLEGIGTSLVDSIAAAKQTSPVGASPTSPPAQVKRRRRSPSYKRRVKQ